MRFILPGLIALVSLTIFATLASAQGEANFRKPKDDADLRYWLTRSIRMLSKLP